MSDRERTAGWRRSAASLGVLVVIASAACAPEPLRDYVVERNHGEPIAVRAANYAINTSGQTACATFRAPIDLSPFTDAGGQTVATICDVHLVRQETRR